MIYILIIIGIIFIYALSKSPITHRSNWHHSFINLQFSSQEFYRQVEETLKKHNLPDISYSRITHSQGGIFSSKREYLRISREAYNFDICAAPFGNDFFVSWWFGETSGDFLSKIPVINTLLGKNAKLKTYYQLDTEAMFRGSVKQAVQDAIDQITTTKGLRALSEMERMPIESK